MDSKCPRLFLILFSGASQEQRDLLAPELCGPVSREPVSHVAKSLRGHNFVDMYLMGGHLCFAIFTQTHSCQEGYIQYVLFMLVYFIELIGCSFHVLCRIRWFKILFVSGISRIRQFLQNFTGTSWPHNDNSYSLVFFWNFIISLQHQHVMKWFFSIDMFFKKHHPFAHCLVD